MSDVRCEGDSHRFDHEVRVTPGKRTGPHTCICGHLRVFLSLEDGTIKIHDARLQGS